MAVSKPPVVIHQHTALMICQNAAILEELLAGIDLEGRQIQRLGARAIVAPADQVVALQSALNQQGIYPRVVGRVPEQGGMP